MDHLKTTVTKALLSISEDSLSFINSQFFNCLKTSFFFAQMIGYVFNPYEVKSLERDELLYFSQFTSNASITFVLYQREDDNTTLIVFYLLFISHLLVYAMILLIALKKVLNI